jgi:hypothetical protein
MLIYTSKSRLATVVFIFLLSTVLSSPASAQLDNSPFDLLFPVDSTKEDVLELRLNAFGFNKNNEFFNQIETGRTYFGYHFWPSLSYQPSKDIVLQFGTMLWQDFGRDDPVQVIPTFTFKYQWKKFEVIFGNLEGATTHGMPEPLLDFERVINRRLETGLQLKYNGDRVFADIFLDWQRMIYEGSDFQENIFHGTRLGWYAGKGDRSNLLFTLQGTVQHLGGQINAPSVTDPIITLYNIVPGFRWEQKLGDGFIHDIFIEGHYMFYANGQELEDVPWQSGWAVYPNLGFKSHIGNMTFSYWRGDQYYTPFGGPMFSGVSRLVQNKGYTESLRELLLVRLTNNIKIGENVTLVSRFTPMYDFQNNKTEFYFGLYFPLDMRFKLASGLQDK